jgi:cysteine desulfurase
MVYMDNAATTSVRAEVLEKMLPYFTENYSNPSAVYSFAQKSKNAVEDARAVIAKTLNAAPSEIYFTAGGSESDNWALKVVAEKYKDKGGHIITTAIEHHAILHTAEYLEKNGFSVTYLDPDGDGIISAEAVEAAIRPDTVLVSVMAANNEVGTLEPIKAIGEVAHRHGIFFHTDAVQAYGHIPIDVEEMNIDLLSASGHKFNGPKGVGFLYVNNLVKFGSFIHGGSQERGRRAGTINVPGIVGMAEAARLHALEMDEDAEYVGKLRDYLIEKIQSEIPYTYVNGSLTSRLPNNINVSFEFIEGETLLIMLDQQGICASSGSACTSGSINPSHVLKAMGVSDSLCHSALRLTISHDTTYADADYVVSKLKEDVLKLRSMSSEYERCILKK